MSELQTIGCLEQVLVRLIRKGRVFYQTDKFNCSWNRIGNDISKGTFTMPATRGCCPPSAHAWADKIEFERNGVVEWAGDIIRPVLSDGVLKVEAMDLLNGYQYRIVRDGLNFVQTDVSDIMAAVISSADYTDPIPVVPVLVPTGVLADRLYPISDYRYAWDILKNDLFNIGLDFSMVGVLLYAGDFSNLDLKPLYFNERMVEGIPDVGEDGAAYANRIIAKGANGLVSIYPPGPAVVPAPFPLVEAVVDASDAEDQATLDLLAKQHYDLRSAVPRFVSFDQGVTLVPDTPFPLRAFIPNRLVQTTLDTECAVVQEAQRLQELTYQLTRGKEEIKIKLVPTGTVSAGVVG